jgi:hypothetical protein
VHTERAAFVHTATSAQLDRSHTCILRLRWPGGDSTRRATHPFPAPDSGHHERMALALVAAALVATGSTGVTGKALIDPARPVCTIDQPCTAPDAHETLAFWRSSRRVGTASTKTDGSFRIALAPGIYRVTLPRRTGFMSRLTPLQVRVPRTGFAHVTFRVDVGIR